MFFHRKNYSIVMAFLALSACTDSATSTPSNITLFDASIITSKGLHASISTPEQTKSITSDTTQLEGDKLTATISDSSSSPNEPNKTLAFAIDNTWRGSLQISSDQSLDLTPYMANGSIDLQIQIDDFKKTALDIEMGCGEGCDSSVRLREWALQAENQGWQTLSIPLACFEKDNAKFNAVNKPVTLHMGGKGQLSIASISISADGPTNFNCADRASLTTTPDILNEYWAEDWWMPRHNEKVALAQQGNIDLLMIGDSITHGWENRGKEVWEKHFGDISTLNIGFGGDRTENVIWRLQHNTVDGISPKLAVMMIGTNNTGHRFDKPQYIANGVEKIIDELATRLPNTPVLLLAIFPRSASADDKLRLNNEQTNVLLETLAEQYPQVEFANFNTAFLTADGTLTEEIMPDLLHPHGEGYELWATQLTPFIKKYLNK